MTSIVVVVGAGPVNAADVAIGLAELAELIFVCADPAHQLIPVFAELSEVIVVENGVDSTARRLVAAEPAAIVTFSDDVMMLTAELASRLNLPFHDRATAARLTDKSLQRARLRECGVDEVRSQPLRSAADWPAALAKIGLPAVLKPAHGCGSRDTYLVSRPEQGRQLADRLLGAGTDYVLEEYLVGRPCQPFGDFVSVESIVSPAGIQHVAITGKLPMAPPFREVGHCWPSPLGEQEAEQVKALVGRAVSALGVTLGLTHTEIKLTPDGPRVIEVNGRLGGYINDFARNAFGINLVEIAGRLALGLPLPPVPNRLDRVYFQLHNLTPTSAFTLLETSGIRELRRIGGITSYRSYCDPGDEFGPSVMSRHFDLIFGVADDHADMFAILDQLRDRLRYRIALPSGEREFTAGQLLEYAWTERAEAMPLAEPKAS